MPVWMTRTFDLPVNLEHLITFVFGVGTLCLIVRHIWEFLYRVRPNHAIPDAIERIGYHFRTKQTVHIYGVYETLPEIEEKGRVKLTPEEMVLVPNIKESLNANNRPNDPHAVLINEPTWADANVSLKVKGLEFAEAMAHLQANPNVEPKMKMISANAVIVCPELRCIVLHRRNPESRTYPSRLHTVGGGYMPTGIGPKNDNYSIKRTVIREIQEETSLTLTFDKVPNLLIMEELENGWIQVAFLGLSISAAQARDIHKYSSEHEGEPERIDFADLPFRLGDPDWVPTGKAAVLTWLALGAPGAGAYARFGKGRFWKATPKEVLDEVLKHPNREKREV
jgi:hypothetical protein